MSLQSAQRRIKLVSIGCGNAVPADGFMSIAVLMGSCDEGKDDKNRDINGSCDKNVFCMF